MYRVLIIWEFVQTLLLLLVPETTIPLILKRKAARCAARAHPHVDTSP